MVMKVKLQMQRLHNLSNATFMFMHSSNLKKLLDMITGDIFVDKEMIRYGWLFDYASFKAIH